MLGMEQGQIRTTVIEPDDAYGQHSGELVTEVARERFPADMELEEANSFRSVLPTGSRQS